LQVTDLRDATSSFRQLNPDWNAEPNAPNLQVVVDADALELTFGMNPYGYAAVEGEVGILRFEQCTR
jgi:hypothetical protein